MKKTLVVLAIVAFAAVLVVGLTYAKGKAPEGKLLYRTHCKVCHGPNSPNGEYSPLSLIQSQWERFFDKKYERKHPDMKAPGEEGKTLKDVITPEMLKKIRTFAVDHAADSESPMTCG